MNRLNVTHCKALYVVIKTRICKNQSLYLQSSDEHSYWLVFALLYWLMFILLSGIFVDVEEFFCSFLGVNVTLPSHMVKKQSEKR